MSSWLFLRDKSGKATKRDEAARKQRLDIQKRRMMAEHDRSQDMIARHLQARKLAKNMEVKAFGRELTPEERQELEVIERQEARIDEFDPLLDDLLDSPASAKRYDAIGRSLFTDTLSDAGDTSFFDLGGDLTQGPKLKGMQINPGNLDRMLGLGRRRKGGDPLKDLFG